MSSFQLPKITVLDANGDPISGALLHFYLTGTTTETNTYSDQALTTPNANPVVCDSAGRAGPIHLDSGITYKCVVADSADTTIYTVDPVAQPGGSTLNLRVDQIASSPLDFGAIGDGAADESTAVQQAIDAATGTVDLLGKTFRCDSAITIKSGLRIINGTLDFSQDTTDTELITATGALGSANNLTANVGVGATVLPVTTAATIANGDWLRLEQGTTEWETTSAYFPGEWVRVKSVSGLNVTVDGPIYNDYNTADTALVKEMTPIKNFVMRDVRIIGATQGGVVQIGLWAKYCENFQVDNCYFENIDDFSIQVRSSLNFRIRDCTFVGLQNGSAVDIHEGCSEGVLSGLTSRGLATGVSIGREAAGDTDNRICQSIVVSDCTLRGSGNGVYVGNGSQACLITGNTIVSDKTASCIYSASGDVQIRGNTTKFGLNGIHLKPDRELTYTFDDPSNNMTDYISLVADNNTIEFPSGSGILITSSSAATDTTGVSICGNMINGCDSYGIYVLASTDDILDTSINNNTILQCDTHYIYVNATSAGTVKRMNICGNTLKGSGYASIDGIHFLAATASQARQIVITDNSIHNLNDGVHASDVSVTTIAKNIFESCEQSIFLDWVQSTGTAAEDIFVLDNRCSSDTGSAIELDLDELSLTNVSISGNIVTTGAQHCIKVDAASTKTIDNLRVSGNIMFQDNDTFDGINVTSNTSGNITGLAIVGNVYESTAGDSFCATITQCKGIAISGNTATSDGGFDIYRCNEVSVTGNTLRITDDFGIRVDADNAAYSGLVVSGNLIDSSGTSAVPSIAVSQSSANAYTAIAISGNTITDIDGSSVIRLSCGNASLGSKIVSASITGNTIHSASNETSGSIYLRGLTGTSDFENVIVSGNHVNRTDATAGTGCVEIEEVAGGLTITNVLVSGNSLIGADHGVIVGSGITESQCAISGNIVTGYAGTALDLGTAVDFSTTSSLAGATVGGENFIE